MRIESTANLPRPLREKLDRALTQQLRDTARRQERPENASAREGASKYKNKRVKANGISFDSKKEAQRYEQLRLLECAGELTDLRLQREFTLQEAYTTVRGERVRAIRYRADFCYTKRDGAFVVEDVKSNGTRTKEYLIKKKLMQERFGLDVVEV